MRPVPDGRYLAYMALVGHADWAAGTRYVAVSRLPWLTALAAWGLVNSYSRGARFAPLGERGLDEPDVGDSEPLRSRHGLVITGVDTAFAVEHRSRWVETPDSPPRGTSMWDDRRAETLVMSKRRPGGDAVLSVRGGRAAFLEGAVGWSDPIYDLDDELLLDARWADWTTDGRLLVATTAGHLQVRDGERLLWDRDLASTSPTRNRRLRRRRAGDPSATRRGNHGHPSTPLARRSELPEHVAPCVWDGSA